MAEREKLVQLLNMVVECPVWSVDDGEGKGAVRCAPAFTLLGLRYVSLLGVS